MNESTGNRIGLEGTKALCEMLKVNGTLTVLGLNRAENVIQAKKNNGVNY